MRTDVAEALNRDASLLRLAAKAAEQLQREDADAAAGRLFAAGDAVVLDRFAGDDAGIEAVVLVVLVHDPGHRWASVPMSGAGMSVSGPMTS